MGGFYLPKAPKFVEGCYDPDFIGRVISAFEEGTEEEISQHLTKGSACVGELLEKASFIKGSVAKRLLGTWEFREIAKRACNIEELHEEWCKKYAYLFQDSLY
jgi:hypothetical protein